MVYSSEGIVFGFLPFESKMRRLSALLDYTDDDTRIQSSPGVTWTDGVLKETDGSPVMVIQAGETIPVTAFALNGRASVVEVLLQVVVGPEMFPHTGLQEVAVS